MVTDKPVIEQYVTTESSLLLIKTGLPGNMAQQICSCHTTYTIFFEIGKKQQTPEGV
jgi:hypothetical protein